MTKAKFLGDGFEFVIREVLICNDDGIVDVAPFDQALGMQHFYFVKETEGSCWRELLNKLFLEIEKTGVLTPKNGVLIINHYGHSVLVGWKGNNIDAIFLVGVTDRFVNNEVI